MFLEETYAEAMKLVFDRIEKLNHGFHGVSIDMRRDGTDWPKKWRIRIVSNKNERGEYRTTVYGDTFKEALDCVDTAMVKQ